MGLFGTRCAYCSKSIGLLSYCATILDWDERKKKEVEICACKDCSVPLHLAMGKSHYKKAEFDKLREYRKYSDTYLKPIFKPTIEYGSMYVDEEHGLFAYLYTEVIYQMSQIEEMQINYYAYPQSNHRANTETTLEFKLREPELTCTKHEMTKGSTSLYRDASRNLVYDPPKELIALINAFSRHSVPITYFL